LFNLASDIHTLNPIVARETEAMNDTDAKTRAAANTPGAEKLETGEQLSLELQSESEHQTGKPKEKMISDAERAAKEDKGAR
jgi:hypothetical protein